MDFSSAPCSFDKAMLSASRQHNLAAFSILYTQAVNSALLLPSNIFVAADASVNLKSDFAMSLIYPMY